MELKDLNELEQESKNHVHQCNLFAEAEKYTSSLRKSDKTLSDIVLNIVSKRTYGSGETAKNYLYEALDEQKHELLRLVELRLSAQAREQKIKAAQKQCLVTASILQTKDI